MITDPGVVVLQIDRVVAGGYGLARTPEGVVLVRGALPGERVTARPARQAGVLRAHAIEILQPHPQRVDLDLPPGADLPLDYEAQLPLKEGLVREALARIAKLEMDLEPIRPSPRALGYRTSAQYGVLPHAGLAARAPGSNRAVPLRADILVAEPVARAFAACAAHPMPGVREVSIRGSIHEDRAMVGLLGQGAGPFARIARALEREGVAGVEWGEVDPRGRFRGAARHLVGAHGLLEDFGGVMATVTVRSFAQVNPLAAGLMYREAAELAGSGARAVDLYAGGGVLALHLASRFADVIAIEIAADAVRRGEADARRLGANTVRFHRGDARVLERFLPADVVTVNPPRAGLGSDVRALLAEHAPPRIVYVSCDPATWARDVADLVARGYRLTSARPFDFYPYTHHVEVLSLLER